MSVLPSYVAEAAERLKQGDLGSDLIERAYAPDETPILNFLRVLNESGEPVALTVLAKLLRNYPMILQHPYVWDILSRLYHIASPLDELNKYAEDWLSELIKAWAEGMTFGFKISITKPKPGGSSRGQRPELFPHLEDTEGWLFTEEALKDRFDARDFKRAYEDLMARLEPCLQWKADRLEYREDPADTTQALVEGVEQIGLAFKSFKRDWPRFQGEDPSEKTVREVVRQGMQVRVRGNPRHEIARRLFATQRWLKRNGQAMPLRPGLVDSTLETLRRHGIESDIDSEEPGRDT